MIIEARKIADMDNISSASINGSEYILVQQGPTTSNIKVNDLEGYFSGQFGPSTIIDIDPTFSGSSDIKVPSQKAVKTAIDVEVSARNAAINAAVTGLVDLKGVIDCSSNPNYPSASKGDGYKVSVAGKIGGSSGSTVQIGDFITAIADSASGSQASVGSNWFIVQANLIPDVDYTTPDYVSASVQLETLRAMDVEDSKLDIDDIADSGSLISGTPGKWVDSAGAYNYIPQRAGYLFGPPSALTRLARDAFEFKTGLNSRKFSMLITGDSLGPRSAGFIANYFDKEFRNQNLGVALVNTGELWTGGAAPAIGVPIAAITSPAVVHSIATSNPDYTRWPTGAVIEIPATGIAQATGGDGRFTFSQLTVYYVQEPGAGTLDVQTSTNGSSWTTIATISANGVLAGGVSSTSVTRGIYYVRVVGNAGTVYLIGFRLEGGTGAGWLGAGMTVGELSLANASTTPSAIVQPIIQNIDPSIITVHFDDDRSTFENYFENFKNMVGSPTSTWLVIGNGPKSPANGGNVVSQGQCDWLRENSDRLGFAMFDGMRASGNYEILDDLGLGGDGIHLSSSVYAQWADHILRQIVGVTSFFRNANRTNDPSKALFGELSFSTNETWNNPSATTNLAGKILPDSTNFFVRLLSSRGVSFQTLADVEIASFVSFEGNAKNMLPPRFYMNNMTGALSSFTPYTSPTTGGVLHVEGNEIKWRDASTGIIHKMYKTGTGSPEGVVTGSIGSIYTRTDGGTGTTLYIKESGSGNTGWIAK